MRGRRLSIKVNPVLLFSKKIGSVFILIRFKVLDPSEQGEDRILCTWKMQLPIFQQELGHTEENPCKSIINLEG